MNFTALLKSAKKSIIKHSPEILTGIGVAGMITAIVMAVKSTPKAVALIEQSKEDKNLDKLSPLETVKTTWQCYIPSAVTAVLSVSCILGASSQNIRRNAALATAYSLSETALKEYQGKVTELFGEKKHTEIKDSIAQDRINSNPVEQHSVIITGKGESLCYDCISGRYFKSDYDTLKKAINEINRLILQDGFASLNDFYYEIGLEDILFGTDLGWGIEDGLKRCVDIDFSSRLTSDGTPCIVVGYSTPPYYNYDK